MADATNPEHMVRLIDGKVQYSIEGPNPARGLVVGRHHRAGHDR